MGKRLSFFRRHLRTWVQICFAALSNGYAAGFAKGTIYKGSSKLLCVPGLNCYSCPGALGSCPIGSFQAVIASRNYQFTFYVTGFLLFFGALLGRFVCGWLCPFGLVQDLLHKIPFVKKLRKLPGDRWLRFLKYVILVGFVIVLPLTVLDIVGQGQPWFCKYICPSGTLFAGIPLVASNPALQSALGWLFNWKVAVLVALLLLSVVGVPPLLPLPLPPGRHLRTLQSGGPVPLPDRRPEVHPLRRLPEGLPHGHPGALRAQQPGVHPLRQVQGRLPPRRHLLHPPARPPGRRRNGLILHLSRGLLPMTGRRGQRASFSCPPPPSRRPGIFSLVLSAFSGYNIKVCRAIRSVCKGSECPCPIWFIHDNGDHSDFSTL